MNKFKIVFFLFLSFQLVAFCQAVPFTGKKVRSIDIIKIQGSPYKEKMFSKAKIGSIEPSVFMRYNIFKDEFEYITPKNDSLILDKTDAFSEITFATTNKKYELTTYTDSNNKLFYGYLCKVHSKNEIHLFRKDNITFTDEKLAKTTLESNKPAKYTLSSPSYFIKFKDKSTTEFPESKKGIVKMFPEKKSEIEAFFKENKINFSDENDLKKVVALLAGF